MADNIISGRFSKQEDDFIKKNYLTMTDEQIGVALKRTPKSIVNRRVKLSLTDKQKNKFVTPAIKDNRSSYLSSLSETEKSEFLKKELRASALYGQIKEVLDKKDLDFYEAKYVDFMSDPSIETVTSMEKDTLHEMTMAQLRIFRYMREEQDEHRFMAKEIKEMQDVVAHCQESLNVQRKQRLKNSNDQATNFSSIIKELKDPNVRREVGYEAAMLKFMAELYYNQHRRTATNPNGNIISGKDEDFDLNILFKSGIAPSGLRSDFTGNENTEE